MARSLCSFHVVELFKSHATIIPGLKPAYSTEVDPHTTCVLETDTKVWDLFRLRGASPIFRSGQHTPHAIRPLTGAGAC
jgi:hypothetical protein